MDILNYLLVPFQHPMLLLLVAVGTFAGIYVGAIPGLSGTMAVSLLVSFTYGWNASYAIALMIGVYVGVVYGGSRSAILLNIPGAPAAVATSFDGYALAQKGLAGKAMGIATTQSVVGTFLGILVLATCAPLVAKLAIQFGSVDYLILGIMGMMMVGSLSSKSLSRGFISAALGILLGTIGMDELTAVPRFTFGNVYFMTGVDYVVAMIGLFGASEVLIQLSSMDLAVVKQKLDKIVPAFKSVIKYMPLTIYSSVIGVLVGALPGAGGDVAALLSYDQAKRLVKNPETPFGEGAIEGIVAPESANNAAIGGAFIPMLTLGIPGDAITAVMISALTIHGMRLGPNFLNESPDFFYLIVSCLCIAGVCLVFFGLTGIRIFAKIVEIPKGILMPTILILSVVGAYAINKNMLDVVWMFAFGMLGYVMKKYHVPVAPMILGIILTDMLEKNFRRGIVLNGSVWGILTGIIKSPISVVLLLLLITMFVTQTKAFKLWKQRKKRQK